MVNPAFSIGNTLLTSAEPETYARLAPHLELVTLKHRETIHGVTGPVSDLYFPTTALISLFVDMANGASAEVALIGNDGALGVMALICGTRAPFRVTVDTEGLAYRIKLELLRSELSRSRALRRACMCHLTARMAQIAGNAVCNGQHSVEQRLCRALLMRLDRVRDHSLFLTHEMMAQVLGVHRPAVTEAAAHLRDLGALTYQRGRVLVQDAEVLRVRACECYAAIKEQVERLPQAWNDTPI